LIGWLVGWLVGWLIGWLVGWLVVFFLKSKSVGVLLGCDVLGKLRNMAIFATQSRAMLGS